MTVMLPLKALASFEQYKRQYILSVVFLFLLFTSGYAAGTTFYSRQSGDWNDPNSWSTAGCAGAVDGSVPISTSTVIICTHTITLTANASCTNLTINSTGVLTVSSLSTFSIGISNKCDVQVGGRIYLNGLGSTSASGSNPGRTASASGGGAGYGGNGGTGEGGVISATISYGSLTSPVSLGSGGGNSSSYGTSGGVGGGAVKIIITNTFICSGTVTANGTDGTSGTGGGGGGSGGSIWIDVGTGKFQGTGKITANGGNGVGSTYSGGGGGGGRIAIYTYSVLFTGSVTAFGGSGNEPGGAGTYYYKLTNSDGELYAINSGTLGSVTPLDLTTVITYTNVVVSNQANLYVTGSQASTIQNLTIKNGGVLSGVPLIPYVITISNKCDLQASGKIDFEGVGYGSVAGSNPGRTASASGGGAGYGGNGGTGEGGVISATISYGSLTSPVSLGSGGGNSSSYATYGGGGGGAVKLIITNTFICSGTVTANGTDGTSATGGGGGGSGGSIWIDVSTGKFQGTGKITADGGDGAGLTYTGGGGGGGRIAIYSASIIFTGSVTAYGGTGYQSGGAGTYFNQLTGSDGDLYVTNASIYGSRTIWDVTDGTNYNYVFVSGQANLNLKGTQTSTIRTLNIANTGHIDVDALGYGSVLGSNPGRTASASGGGAGYGGNGGTGEGGVISATISYGSLTSPVSLGSGGGNSSSYATYGGEGGGAVKLIITNTFICSGTLTANGTDGTSATGGGGGGSGGSIWIDVSTGKFQGTGKITADGGDGAGTTYTGGGGGGGRIAIYSASIIFTGSVTAYGGTGYQSGGAGTYFNQLTGSDGDLYVTNASIYGSRTIWDVTDGTNYNYVFVSGQANLNPKGTQTSTIRTLNIENTGHIDVDALGYGSVLGTNPGRTASASGGGAGYGGNGGTGEGGVISATISYGSLTSPVSLGSGGGNSSSYGTFGGVGGGAVKIIITNTFICSGTVTANGTDGTSATGGGGGGTGGSIWIDVSTGKFQGTGRITADGGDGAGTTYTGGGGGGGRIAIYSASIIFTGSVTAYGGTGYQSGGAGTYYKKTIGSNGDLYVINGRTIGSRTPLDLTLSNIYDLISVSGQANLYPTGTQNSIIYVLNITNAGLIDVNGMGYGSSTGSGAGNDGSASGGGAGYGGAGGTGETTNAGGVIYGASVNPVDLGSGGGNSTSYGTYGGDGGGAIKLIITNTFICTGTVTANGTNGTSGTGGGGGGSGGSIQICSTHITGTGYMTSNGGNGAGSTYTGGGGAGGRIALYYTVYSFSGTRTVNGGTGYVAGVAGTIYTNTTYSLCPGGVALPITLLSFTGKNQGSTNMLFWKTASEINNNYFTIEASPSPPSGGALEWVAIGNVKGAGNSTSIKNYSLPDEVPYSITYYRLKQTDYDGKYEYFGPISIAIDMDAVHEWELFLLGTPASDELKIKLLLPDNFSSGNNSQLNLEIIDLQGRILKQEKINAIAGANYFQMELNDISVGMYFVRIYNNKNTLQERFVKISR